MRRPQLRRIESLESRLAPAGVVTFTDVDGDLVTVRTNLGTNESLTAALFLVPAGGVGGFQLAQVFFSDPVFAGTRLRITAQPGTGGDGQVNVDRIWTNGLDLGAVTVGGDVGTVAAGDTNGDTPGIASLVANSIGRFGTDPVSHVNGSLPILRVSGDLTGGFSVSGRAGDVEIGGSIDGTLRQAFFGAASIGRIVVGGTVIGGSAEGSGRIQAVTGGIDRVVIGGSLRGGLGNGSGMVFSQGAIGFARIGGSIVGDGFGPSGAFSGAVASVTRGITRLVVGGGIYGGAGSMYSGAVYATGAIGSMVVGGPVDGTNSAAGGDGSAVIVAGSIGSLDIGGGLVGGAGRSSGVVNAVGRIGTLRVGRIQAGVGVDSGSVRARTLGTMLVRGDVLGSTSQPAIISAVGAVTPTGPRAIDSLTVVGNLVNTVVLGGYQSLNPVNGAARIGAVTVRGSLFSSSVVAGVMNIGVLHPISGMPQFGDGLDMPIAGRRGSRIDSLVVNGLALGAPDLTDYSGVVANSIGTVRIGGRPYTATRTGITPTSPNLQFRLVR